LRATVSVTAIGFRHVLFAEYARSIPKPSAIAIVNLPPLRGQSVFVVDPALIYALVDKLMGGGGRAYRASRDFTEIEFRVADRIMQKLLGDLKSAASRFVDLAPSITRIENNIEFVTICSGMDRVVSLAFEVKMGETTGTMDVTIPIGAFEPVIDRFDPVEELPERTAAEKAEDFAQIQQTLREVRLGLRIVIGETDMPVSRARSLAEGDVVVLDRRITEPVDVLVEGVPKFFGVPGRLNGKKGIKLHSIIKGGERD
jgi:flagellar motor switch protein FliM